MDGWLGGCGGWQGGLGTTKLTVKGVPINVIHSFLKAVGVSNIFEL